MFADAPSAACVYLVISAKTRDNVTSLRYKQKVVHVLEGLADAVAAAVAALGFAWIIRDLSCTALYLRIKIQVLLTVQTKTYLERVGEK